LLGQIHIDPTGEQILEIPGALAVTYEDEFTGHVAKPFDSEQMEDGRYTRRRAVAAGAKRAIRTER
jgi:hypothetical protein